MKRFRPLDECQHVCNTDLGWGSPEKRKQPFGAQIGHQAVIESEQYVGGKSPLRFGFTPTPFGPKGGKKRVIGIKTVSSLDFFP
jgi:hypothetical protein